MKTDTMRTEELRNVRINCLQHIKRFVVVILASGLYSGYFPIASGTAGSVVGIGVYLLLSTLSISTYLFITVGLFFLGVWVSTEAESIFNEKDSSKVVIDEIVGMLITMTTFPAQWEFILAGFLLFRFFDIWKPFSALENIRGGWGVMLDDVAAGIISFGILQIGKGYLL